MHNHDARRRQIFLAATLATLGAAGTAHAQSFPSKPIRVVVPFAPGNTFDIVLRFVSDELVKNGGQPLVIDNKPGGGGVIAAQTVAIAPPDGYTILLASLTHLAINPHTMAKLPYDPQKTFKPITNLLAATMLMAVNASVPAKTLKEFVAWAKANPGKTSFASFSAGNTSHFAGVMLNKHTGIDMVHVPYSGTPPAVQSLLAGHTQVAFVPLPAIKAHVDAGKVRVLAATGTKAPALMPDLPTFRALGYPELEILLWGGLLAPAGTPDAIVNTLNRQLTAVLRSPAAQAKFASMDFEPLPTTPEAFAQLIRDEGKRWGEVVRLSGFKPQK